MRRVFCLLAFLTLSAEAQPPSADLVLQHGTILTLDAGDHVAQAVAIKDGRLLAVGSDQDIAALIGPKTQVIDLAGKTATPGLIDTHAHILNGGLVELFGIDLTQTTSLAELLAKVKARTAAARPGAWIQGAGWNDGILAERRAPTLAELDAVSRDNPVALTHVSGHFVMVNSAALALLHLGKEDPPGGTIERDAQGNPTGIFKENAQDLVRAIIPPASLAERQAAITAMIDKMHAEGMTGVKDPLLSPEEWAAYLDLARHAGLSAHVCGLIGAGSDLAAAQLALTTVRQAQHDIAALPVQDLGICGVKIFMDGALTAHTAWMTNDYPTDAAHPGLPGRGYPTVPPDTYRQMIELFTREGVTVGTHVIGDRGSDFVVDTYAGALARFPHQGLRHSLIHVSLPSDHALEMLASLQHNYDSGIVETQSEFLWALGGVLPRVVRPDLLPRAIPLAEFARRGILYASSSDFPVTPLPARYGLWASVAREPVTSPGTHPFGTAEAATVQAALRSYTINAAHQMFLEKQTGSLEKGKWADIAVWDRNPYAVPTADLKDMRCLQTFFKGREVFRR